MTYVFKPHQQPSVAVKGSPYRFPVHRIYCVGRNYADHTREMGGDPARDKPIFFTKPAGAILETGEKLPYPMATKDLHHEIELVVALGSGGRKISAKKAKKLIFGYAVGNDFTRRDLQAEARKKGQPWDSAKGFDGSAAIGMIVPASDAELSNECGIGLKVNGEFRQRAKLGDMIWSVAEIISELSHIHELYAGDLIYTGTPAGVGPVEPGDKVEGSVQGLGTVMTTIGKAVK